MLILGIETSCDETAMAVLRVKDGMFHVLSNVVSSQVKLHAKYGGVVPSLTAREHVKNLPIVFRKALKDAGLVRPNSSKLTANSFPIDLIAVTRGPGLAPALLVGIKFAKELAQKYGKPIIGVNHLEGHIYSNWLSPIGIKSNVKGQMSNVFPALCLIVSGGHTELVLMRGRGKYAIIGETLDDAVGESFDKVARLLGLGYPGGPQIARHAEQFARTHAGITRTNAETKSSKLKANSSPIEFPMPMVKSKSFDFSYSGLKTAVLYKVRELAGKSDISYGNLKNKAEKKNKQLDKFDTFGQAKIGLDDKTINEICYAFQKAAIDVLILKTKRAALEYGVKSIMLSGGVSANKYLRESLAHTANTLGIAYFQPDLSYTGDNAAMIAAAGYFNFVKGQRSKVKGQVDVDANLRL